MNKRHFFTLITVLTVGASLVLSGAQTGLAAPPTNDDFYGATVVSGLPFSESIDTTEATTGANDPWPCGYYPYASVWYEFTPSVDMAIEINTTGSSYNTAVGVYTGDYETSLNQETCADSGYSQASLNAGITYFIEIVDNSGSGMGGSLQISLAQLPPPANDNFAGATVIGSLPFPDPADNTSATIEPGEPDPGCTYDGIYKTIWYAYTPTEAGVLIGSTTNYYSFVGVYTGSVLGDLVLSTCTSFGNSFQVDITPGTTVYIQIGSPLWSYGQMNLSLSFGTQPQNDDFADAIVITSPDIPVSFDNTYATHESGEPNPGCLFNSPYRTIWFVYTPTQTGILSGYLSWSDKFLGVYTGSSIYNLDPIACTTWGNAFQANINAGTPIYIQIGSLYDGGGTGDLFFSFTPAPPNDNFANAELVGGVPYSSNFNNTATSTETGEPSPGCVNGIFKTVWFQYTPDLAGSLTAEKYGFPYSFMAIYTGSELTNLFPVSCGSFGWDQITIPVEAGVTYYFQIGSFYDWDYGDLSFNLYETPPTSADFWFSPYDPSRFDNVQFCDSTYDPVGAGFSEFWWDFGDGVVEGPTSNSCTSHYFGVDGNYTVTHGSTTTDGRSAEVTKEVQVRTHDVAITKFTVPQSARVGQTRQITVGIRNNLYEENVMVELYKSTPNGYTYVGNLTQYVPVRPSGRTTDFNFSYTFAPEDALMGKVKFRAYAYLNSARDALPLDNEAISLPTKVTGGTPYTAAITNPPGVIGAASMFGLMGSGLAFGAILVNGRPKKWAGRKEKRNG